MLVRFGLKIGNEVHVRLAAHQPHDKIATLQFHSAVVLAAALVWTLMMSMSVTRGVGTAQTMFRLQSSIAFVPSMRGAIASRQILESQKFPAPNGTSTLRE
jgi:hypothetical protein